MEENPYKQAAVEASRKLGYHAKQNAKIHGYKVAKLGARGFIYACKALFQQGVLVVKGIFK